MNWSEEVERDNEYGDLPSLPPPVEEFDKEKGLKIVTEYRYDSNEKKVMCRFGICFKSIMCLLDWFVQRKIGKRVVASVC